MSPALMVRRSRCAPACPGCTRRYRRLVAISSAFGALAIVLGALAAVYASLVLGVAGALVLIRAVVYLVRALRARTEVRAAEAVARRYGGAQ